jgi:hypothetical protein
VEGEKPSKYFSALLKQRSSNSAITSLSCSTNGVDVSLLEIEDILEEASSFYATLYSDKLLDSEKEKASSFLKKNVSSKLSEDEKRFCDQETTEEELGRALKNLPSGKAPGIDGLPAEFFKRYWHDLKADFVAVLIKSFKSGSLPETMKLSIITLIHKKDSRSDIKNYRPISLLCTDYKILAKCLAERMNILLPTLIGIDQTGFMKNRYIGENITLFLDIQEHLSNECKHGLCFLADWEKAYDLIDRSFLHKCLVHFGFGPIFSRWFLLLHKDTYSKLTINSFLGSPLSSQEWSQTRLPLGPLPFLMFCGTFGLRFKKVSITGHQAAWRDKICVQWLC